MVYFILLIFYAYICMYTYIYVIFSRLCTNWDCWRLKEGAHFMSKNFCGLNSVFLILSMNYNSFWKEWVPLSCPIVGHHWARLFGGGNSVERSTAWGQSWYKWPLRLLPTLMIYDAYLLLTSCPYEVSVLILKCGPYCLSVLSGGRDLVISSRAFLKVWILLR